MAVNDIESFFLNKDKKKKSKKVITINPASLLEKTKETENKKTKKVSEKQSQNHEPQSELLRKTKEDDDWEDNCEEEVDLANLRIGMMPVKTEETRPKVEVLAEEVSDGEEGERVDKQAHPWGARANNVAPQEIEIPEPAQPQKYVAPSLRGTAGVAPGSRAPKKAPNIGNSTEFPSLREAVDIETDDGTWSRVTTKNGHSTQLSSQERSSNATKRDPPPPATITAAATVVTTTTAENKTKPDKYVPPHLRNKYQGLKEESLN